MRTLLAWIKALLPTTPRMSAEEEREFHMGGGL